MTLKNNIILNVSETLHETKVQANLWTPNGQYLISCGANGYLRIFDNGASKLKNMVKTREAINYLKANNTYIIGGHQSRLSITIWNQEDLNVIFALCLSGGRTLNSLSFLGEEQFIFSTDRGELAKYRVGELKPSANVEVGDSVITLSQIEPSTQLLLASGDTKGSIKFWSTHNLAMRYRIPNYNSTLSHLVWRPSMDFSQPGIINEFAIATCSKRNSVQFWDINIEGIAASGRLPQITLASIPKLISFHPDGTYLAIVYQNAITLLQLIHLTRRDILAQATITSIEWSSQTHLLMVGMSQTMAIVDVECILLPASATLPVSSALTPQLGPNAL